TIHIRHFFGFPSYFSEKQGTVYVTTNIWSPKNQEVDCWIGFHDWSRSGGRRGGPFPQQGQWHNTNPKVWLNRKLIEPPVWKNHGLAEKTEEIPFEDENYSFRKPAKISLKKGWNEVLLKVPQGGKSWKWMFTFVPVRIENEQVKEIEGLKFSVDK
ncbi:MAG: beta-N-acetylhexosaminidase, partial [Bacteroidota bacterium]|nr:beta-N-acetylhexosaminidase [Bacteroidota bacterium]